MSEKKYCILAENQRQGRNVVFDVMYYAKSNVNLPRAMEAMKSPVKFCKTMIHRNTENKWPEGENSYGVTLSRPEPLNTIYMPLMIYVGDGQGNLACSPWGCKESDMTERLNWIICWWPGEGNGNPLWYSCLENLMDWGAWRARVHGVAKSWTQLSH